MSGMGDTYLIWLRLRLDDLKTGVAVNLFSLCQIETRSGDASFQRSMLSASCSYLSASSSS